PLAPYRASSEIASCFAAFINWSVKVRDFLQTGNATPTAELFKNRLLADWSKVGRRGFMKRKAPLRTILGQSEIPSGGWTISRLSAKQAQAISPALRPQRVN